MTGRPEGPGGRGCPWERFAKSVLRLRRRNAIAQSTRNATAVRGIMLSYLETSRCLQRGCRLRRSQTFAWLLTVLILIKAKKVLGIWICLLEAGRVHVC